MDDLYKIPDGLNPDQEKHFRDLAESHTGLVDRMQTVRGLVKIPVGGNGGQNGTGAQPARSKDTPSPLKSIRQFCMQCKGGSGGGRKPWKAVRECQVTTCPLHPFRMGKNPFQKLTLTGTQRNQRVAIAKSLQTPVKST